jgi:hypothetical protein
MVCSSPLRILRWWLRVDESPKAFLPKEQLNSFYLVWIILCFLRNEEVLKDFSHNKHSKDFSPKLLNAAWDLLIYARTSHTLNNRKVSPLYDLSIQTSGEWKTVSQIDYHYLHSGKWSELAQCCRSVTVSRYGLDPAT